MHNFNKLTAHWSLSSNPYLLAKLPFCFWFLLKLFWGSNSNSSPSVSPLPLLRKGDPSPRFPCDFLVIMQMTNPSAFSSLSRLKVLYTFLPSSLHSPNSTTLPQSPSFPRCFIWHQHLFSPCLPEGNLKTQLTLPFLPINIQSVTVFQQISPQNLSESSLPPHSEAGITLA